MKTIIRKILLVTICGAFAAMPAHAQWTLDWTSTSTASGNAAGWLLFRTDNDAGRYRFYIVDDVNFRVMIAPYSNTAQATYTFSAPEQLAGNSVYSLGEDLTGDNVVDFYVLSNYGADPNYRQAFKIFNLITGATIFERNDASTTYGYPSLWDVDSDGLLECVFTRAAYPQVTNFALEVWQTGVPASTAPPAAMPLSTQIHPNYPNPFNPGTTLAFDLARSANVRIEIFNTLGQKVRTLADRMLPAGSHSLGWNGDDDRGAPLPTGPYYYTILTGGEAPQTRQMILLR